jgi:hypothetical protein
MVSVDVRVGSVVVGVSVSVMEDGVHLLLEDEDGDVGGRGDGLGARRFGRQLLMADVLCLLRRAGVGVHVC